MTTLPPKDFMEKFNKDIESNKTILMILNCSIQYWGRSRSVVGDGDRIILVKPDSTIIVHSLSGFKPLNWMSPPTDTTAEIEAGEKTTVYSQRTVKPYEEMKIAVGRVVDYRSYDGLEDNEDIELTHTEKDMRDYLAENPELIEPGFRLKSKEYRSPLGFFDLYGRIGDAYVVVELKAERAGLPAALQVKRYRDWLRAHVGGDSLGILMAPSITPNALTLLRKDGIAFKKFNVKKIPPKRGKQTLVKWI